MQRSITANIPRHKERHKKQFPTAQAVGDFEIINYAIFSLQMSHFSSLSELE